MSNHSPSWTRTSKIMWPRRRKNSLRSNWSSNNSSLRRPRTRQIRTNPSLLPPNFSRLMTCYRRRSPKSRVWLRQIRSTLIVTFKYSKKRSNLPNRNAGIKSISLNSSRKLMKQIKISRGKIWTSIEHCWVKPDVMSIKRSSWITLSQNWWRLSWRSATSAPSNQKKSARCSSSAMKIWWVTIERSRGSPRRRRDSAHTSALKSFQTWMLTWENKQRKTMKRRTLLSIRHRR